jgi:hypothetical protein
MQPSTPVGTRTWGPLQEEHFRHGLEPAVKAAAASRDQQQAKRDAVTAALDVHGGALFGDFEHSRFSRKKGQEQGQPVTADYLMGVARSVVKHNNEQYWSVAGQRVREQSRRRKAKAGEHGGLLPRWLAPGDSVRRHIKIFGEEVQCRWRVTTVAGGGGSFTYDFTATSMSGTVLESRCGLASHTDASASPEHCGFVASDNLQTDGEIAAAAAAAEAAAAAAQVSAAANIEAKRQADQEAIARAQELAASALNSTASLDQHMSSREGTGEADPALHSHKSAVQVGVGSTPMPPCAQPAPIHQMKVADLKTACAGLGYSAADWKGLKKGALIELVLGSGMVYTGDADGERYEVSARSVVGGLIEWLYSPAAGGRVAIDVKKARLGGQLRKASAGHQPGANQGSDSDSESTGGDTSQPAPIPNMTVAGLKAACAGLGYSPAECKGLKKGELLELVARAGDDSRGSHGRSGGAAAGLLGQQVTYVGLEGGAWGKGSWTTCAVQKYTSAISEYPGKQVVLDHHVSATLIKVYPLGAVSDMKDLGDGKWKFNQSEDYLQVRGPTPPGFTSFFAGTTTAAATTRKRGRQS